MAVSILVRLPQDTVKTLEELASATKQPRNVLIRKALEAYLRECADHQVALDRLRDREDPVIPAGEFRKHLGRKKHRKDATGRRRGPLNRTPILADEETLRALRRIARERGLSLAETMRRALVASAAKPRPRRKPLSITGIGRSGRTDVASRAEELLQKPTADQSHPRPARRRHGVSTRPQR